MSSFVSYAWSQAIAWINNGTGVARATAGQRNSAMCLAASFLDGLASPETIAPRGETGLKYPKVRYHGPLADYDGREVPIVGSIEPPADWLDAARVATLDATIRATIGDRALLFLAILNGVRRLARDTTPPATGSTRPAGQLFGDAYPAGVCAVDGECALAVWPAADPTATLEEGAAAAELARTLQTAIPAVDALTRASLEGRALTGVAESALASQQTTALVDGALEWWKGEKRARKQAMYALGAGLLGAGIGAFAFKPAPALKL